MGWCTAQYKMLLFCVNPESYNFELVCLNKKNKIRRKGRKITLLVGEKLFHVMLHSW